MRMLAEGTNPPHRSVFLRLSCELEPFRFLRDLTVLMRDFSGQGFLDVALLQL